MANRFVNNPLQSAEFLMSSIAEQEIDDDEALIRVTLAQALSVLSIAQSLEKIVLRRETENCNG